MDYATYMNSGVQIVAHTLAIFVGAAALGIGGFLYALHRTVVLRRYLAFLTSLFMFVLSFWFRSIRLAIVELSAHSVAGSVADVVTLLYGSSFLAEAVGGIVLVLILPSLAHSLFNRSVSPLRVAISVITAAVMGVLIIAAMAVHSTWPELALFTLMYGTIGYTIVEMGIWIRRTDSPPHASTRVLALRRFIIFSALFMPFLALDVVVSMAPRHVSSWSPIVLALDNLTVPGYFVLLSAGSIVFAFRFLNEPALMMDEVVTPFAKEQFRLTAREAEVVEYIMEGYTVSDAAKAMKISPRTVETHLYNVYEKTGVASRIELFNLFENRRRL